MVCCGCTTRSYRNTRYNMCNAWKKHTLVRKSSYKRKRALRLTVNPTKNYASVRALTPGKSLPSSNSKDAPPPVLQCVTLSSVSYFLHAVAVSPPPITVTVPAEVFLTTASMSDLVPSSNLAISKTPIGPFQINVFEAATAAALISFDLGPH